MVRSRLITVFVGALIIGWIGWQGYRYFIDPAEPQLTMTGIANGGYYTGDIACTIESTKAGDLYLTLDDKPVADQIKIGLGLYNPSYKFVLSSDTISEGKHTIHAELVDKTFKHQKTSLRTSFNIDNTSLKIALAKSDDFKVFQGRTLHVQFQTNKEIAHAKIRALSQEYTCFPESQDSRIYEAFIPIACEEAPNEYLFSVDVADHIGNSVTLDNKFQVVMYPFKKQNLALDKDKVKKEKELGISIAERERVFEELAGKSKQEKMWRGAFCTPIDIQRVTCDFGTIRTTQEKGRYMHKALDVTNAPHSVIWAPQSGVVILKERFEDSGNTVVIDHGWGLFSMFYHLHDFADITLGQKIAQGNPLGTLGDTGYTKGAHLHWEMRLNNIPVDPMQWTKLTF